jgi:hypothetical protein
VCGTNEGPNKGPNTPSNKGPNTTSNQGPNEGPNKGPNEGPNQGPNKGPYEGPNRGPYEGPNRGPYEGPNRGPYEGPYKGTDQGTFYHPFCYTHNGSAYNRGTHHKGTDYNAKYCANHRTDYGAHSPAHNARADFNGCHLSTFCHTITSTNQYANQNTNHYAKYCAHLFTFCYTKHCTFNTPKYFTVTSANQYAKYCSHLFTFCYTHRRLVWGPPSD